MRESLNEELLSSRDSLLTGRGDVMLLKALKEKFPQISNKVFIFDWIPEQAENIFKVLIDGDKVAIVEISRVNPENGLVDFEVLALAEYLNRHPKLPKAMRRKLNAAIQLSK